MLYHPVAISAVAENTGEQSQSWKEMPVLEKIETERLI